MRRYIKPLADAQFLLQSIRDGKFPKENLTNRQRYVCAMYLFAEEKYTHQEIATMLGVHRQTVHTYSQKMQRNAGLLVDAIDERTMAANLMNKVEVASARLFRKGKESEACDVQFKLVDKLQSLGFLKKRPLEIAGQISFKALMEMVHSETTEGIEDDRRTIIELGSAEAESHPPGSSNGFKENGTNGAQH